MGRRGLCPGLLLLIAALAAAPARAAGPEVPPGFKVSILAHVPEARSMTLCGGMLVVGTRGSAVYAVPLDDPGRRRRILNGLTDPTGVACRDGELYVATRDRVSAWRIGPSGELGERRDVVTGLPNKSHHGLRYIRFGPDGRLYLALGSPCNICVPEGLEGTIVRTDPGGGRLETVASGVRNSVGFDWNPGTGTLFFTDNGADGMGDNRPPDELNEAREPGAWYGFPFFGGTIPLTGFEKRQPPRRQTPPVLDFPAHVATLRMSFYTGGVFPAEYRGSAFVAEHGSWNRSVPDGYQVVLVRFQGGRPVDIQAFATGLGRPVDVRELPDGSIAVSADNPGVVYRISYGQ